MDNIQEIVTLIKLYLEQQMQQNTFWTISDVNDLIPIIQLIIIIITSIAGVYKYYKTKNEEIYEKRLKEVYAPLYMRLVNQEVYRDIMLSDKSVKEVPIIEIISGENTILSRSYFFEIINKINGGLATQELLTLLGLYKSLVHLESTLKEDSEKYIITTIKKVNVEYDLYKEIVRGYDECYKKLGLDKYSNINEWKIINDEIKIKYEVTKEEIEETKIHLKINNKI